jgi:hypothetical protein
MLFIFLEVKNECKKTAQNAKYTGGAFFCYFSARFWLKNAAKLGFFYGTKKCLTNIKILSNTF